MSTAQQQQLVATAHPDIRVAGARAVLREARQRGHEYLELREAGRRIVFFCTLCLTQCYGDSSLWAHLRGSIHARRLAAAARTLFGPLPWPFSDGVLFFNSSSPLPPSTSCRSDRLVAGVLVGEMLSQLPLRISGIGHIAASPCTKADCLRIWCAWLGEGGPDDIAVLSAAPDCDVAVMNLRYRCDLGRRNTAEELSVYPEEVGGSPRKRLRVKSFSDEEATESNGGVDSLSVTRLPREDPCDRMRFLSGKALRREMRKRERLAAERICDICRQRMLPGKDVAALLNLKTGRLACSSRNTNGAFHVFHISCLIHWILLCEFEIWTQNKQNKARGGRGRKGKRVPNGHITTIFCPECQGSGADVREEHLENPTAGLSEIFLHKLKAIQGHRAWMEDPEQLARCSTGLKLPCDKQPQDKALPSKLLHFYQADI